MANEDFDVIDPYTQVYIAIWDLLEASAAFNVIVSPGNKIRYDLETQRRVKDTYQNADLPTVELIMKEGTFRPFATSTNAQDIQTYTLSQVTGNDRLTPSAGAGNTKIGYGQLKYQTIKALAKGGNRLGGLLFVWGWDLVNGIDTLDDATAQKGGHGWSGEIDIVVKMTYLKSVLTS